MMSSVSGAYAASPWMASGRLPGSVEVAVPIGDHVRITVDPRDGIVVRVVDESGDVIRQLPREEQIQLARRLERFAGVALDTTG